MHDIQTAITHVMEPVIPDTLTVITVGGIGHDTKIYCAAIENEQPGLPTDTPEPGALSFTELAIRQVTDECVTVEIPAGTPAVCALHIKPELSADAWLANRPQLDWQYPTQATPCEAFRLVGRNMVSVDNYPTRKQEEPVSYGGFVQDKTTVVARRQGTDAFIEIPVEKSSGYEAYLHIPGDLPEGEYVFFAHNGLGGVRGWSEPLAVQVARQESWPTDVFRVDDYRQAEDASASPAINRALKELEENGGGILQFSRDNYPVTEPIVLPRRTVVCGQGIEQTRIVTPGDAGPLPPYVLFTGDGDFTIEDLRVLTVYTGIIVCAPTFLPETFEEAIDIPFRWSEQRARNVTIQRCHFTQRMASHADRTSAREYAEFIKQYMVRETQASSGPGCVYLAGEDLVVRDNTMLGGGNCVMLMGCTHARVADNLLKTGPAGHGFSAVAKLIWPDDYATNTDAGGAPIKGSYCREIVLEDNEITAYSERARDLVYFMYGGELSIVARNRIGDIECTWDAEGLGCHLWSACWIEPSIRMTSPTTGEIIDPTGEVTRENLDGAVIDVVGGQGLGQVRRIVKREGDRFEIDKPWRVVPDEHSDLVFMAPPPFWRMTFVDNEIYNTGANMIFWGNTHDIVVDGNTISDGIGMLFWSIRNPANQKVWGGIIFSLIVNNTLKMNWFTPDDTVLQKGASGGGIWNPSCKFMSCPDEGYDYLGYIVRNNYLTNNSGIVFKTHYRQYRGEHTTDGSATETDLPWVFRNAGVVVENNHCRDSKVGIMIDDDANLIERDNTFTNVKHPEVWVKGGG